MTSLAKTYPPKRFVVAFERGKFGLIEDTKERTWIVVGGEEPKVFSEREREDASDYLMQLLDSESMRLRKLRQMA
jgi:hypothetical protein